MKNDVRVARDLMYLARELSALGFGQDPDSVETLAAKFLSRLGNARARQLRTYGIELKPTDTVEQLARAWASINLSQ